MARIRQVKPEFFLDDEVAALCTRDTRLCFLGMWTITDREGRLEYRPARIKAQVFPYDDDITSQSVSQFLDQLISGGFIIPYEIDGKRYLWIPNFTKHQHFHRDEQPSKLPEPPQDIKMHRASTVQAPEMHRTCTPASTSTSTYDLRHTASGLIASQSMSAAKGRRRSSQKTGVPPEFDISDSLKEWASKNCPNLDLKEETEGFMDYHRAKGNSFADWDAAWRTWMKNAVKFARQRAGQGGSGLKSDIRHQKHVNLFQQILREQDETTGKG